ncbi:PIG-L deacetylase family protein, partial [Anaerolinea sp.]
MNNDMIFYGRRVLFLGAHPDDIELGCGALIAHIVPHTEIRCVTLSDNQKNPALKNLVEEHYRSMDVLGVPREWAILGPFETRRFPHYRQEILEYLLDWN